MLRLLLAWVSLAAISLTTFGCGRSTPPANIADGHGGSARPAAAAKDDLPGLKSLSPADRALALRQKFCPITLARLGEEEGMAPYKMKLKGREFFLCCDGCKEKVDADPDGTLKKVDALLANK